MSATGVTRADFQNISVRTLDKNSSFCVSYTACLVLKVINIYDYLFVPSTLPYLEY